MAEIVLKIGKSPQYDDGDILCVFNDKQILWKNAEHIFWPRLNNDPWQPRVGGFLGKSYPLLQSSLAKIYRYRFERVSRQEVIKRDLWSGESVVYSPYSTNPNYNMDVVTYIKRHISDGMPFFGENGGEIWYDGESDYSIDNARRIWDGIEYYTSHCIDENKFWPAGGVDLKHFFFVSTEDFDDKKARDLIISSDRTDKTKKRNRYVSWRDLPGFSSGTGDKIVDKNIDVDIRKKAVFGLGNIIINKEK